MILNHCYLIQTCRLQLNFCKSLSNLSSHSLTWVSVFTMQNESLKNPSMAWHCTQDNAWTPNHNLQNPAQKSSGLPFQSHFLGFSPGYDRQATEAFLPVTPVCQAISHSTISVASFGRNALSPTRHPRVSRTSLLHPSREARPPS